ncbi:MAG: hypothetical protein ACXWQA_07040 [Pseudobdellovibrionaceae bacterium]
MDNYDDSKYQQNHHKHQNRLDELRERNRQRLAELREKMDFQAQTLEEKKDFDERQAQKSHSRRVMLKEMELEHRSQERAVQLERREQEQAEQREFNEFQTLARAEAGLELEQLRHELREAERLPNFQDFQRRAELEFLIRRQERLDQNQIDNKALERRITEFRSLNRHDIHKLVLVAAFEHLHGEAIHRRTVAELQEDTDAEMMKAEQAHRHKLREDDNASRLRVSEMFSEKLFDLVFSQMGGSAGLSQNDLEKIVSEWEKEGDKLKR